MIEFRKKKKKCDPFGFCLFCDRKKNNKCSNKRNTKKNPHCKMPKVEIIEEEFESKPIVSSSTTFITEDPNSKSQKNEAGKTLKEIMD